MSEVETGYRDAGIGEVLITCGQARHSAPLSAALLRAVDANRDQVTSLAEWTNAESAFLKLDANRDGLLGPGELVERCVYLFANDRLQAEKLPRQVLAIVSLGHHRTILRSAPHLGPAWFLAMDRNQDGDVARNEFTGGAADFSKLDLNGDGAITAQEADSQPVDAP